MVIEFVSVVIRIYEIGEVFVGRWVCVIVEGGGFLWYLIIFIGVCVIKEKKYFNIMYCNYDNFEIW